LFYQQLNAPEMFERALSGITWCYLKTGEYEKAETVLRKLINQSPESAVGVEGILILARRYLQKARQSWGKYDYIEKERTRLEMFLERVDKIAKTDSADSKSSAISAARKRLYALLDRIGEEKVADRETIMAYYTNIDKLCTFITSHYYTGTYQETFFSRSRERMLAIIDSTLETMAKNGNHEPAVSIVSNPQIERTRIKTIVDDATIFSVLGLIDKYKWENEFVEWRKKQINRLYEAASPDTIVSDDTVTSGSKKALTRKNQEGAIDSLLTYERAMNRRYSEQLKLQIERLLSGEIDSSDQCYLYYQLGELYYREENSDYTEQYEIHEKMIANGKNGKLQPKTGGENGPVEKPPVLDHVKSMRFFRSAVEKSPSSVFAGAATYCLAWCFNDAGQIDSAYYYMKKLARTYPDNPHTPQAWMFCGEYYFDKGNLEKALESFLWVMKYPESEWFDEALYKVAWTQYRMSNPEKAISSFLALVDLGYGVLGKSILEKESMDYIAISFSEIDASGQKGLERAAAFTRKLGDMKRSCQILYRLAQVYREQGRYEIAQKTYQLLLSTYPAYEMNPQVEAEMLIVQEHTVPTEVSIEKKYDYFKKYNRTSAWALKQNDSVRTVADSISAKMLYDAAVSFHQHALQGTNDTNYQKAIMAYTDYIDRYQTWPLANECHYNLAEIRFSLGDYRAAVEEFMTVSQRYPDSKYKETAAWNAIVAAQNILKTETAGKKQEKR
jgi:TolA-binding protein